MNAEQQPIEMILARGLMSNLTTPAFLVDEDGTLVFFNDTAGLLLGLRFEEAGRMSRDDWGARLQRVEGVGRPVALSDRPLYQALKQDRPFHTHLQVRGPRGDAEIEVSAFPSVGTRGKRGAMAIFWTEDEAS